MSEQHDSDETAEAATSNHDDNSREAANSVQRRKVLRSIGAATGATISFGMLPNSAAAQSDKTKLSGDERKKVINDALAEYEIQSLIEHHSVIKSIRSSDAVAVSVPFDSQPVRIVRIPFVVDEEELNKNTTKTEDSYILWSDSETIDTIAAYIAYDEKGNRRAVNYYPHSV